MRYMRSSFYAHPDRPPVIVVVAEDEITDTLESLHYSARQPGGLLLTDIFEADADLDQHRRVVLAGMRAKERASIERNQVVLYFWCASMFSKLKPGATLGMPKPAPLSHEDIAVVFEQLAEHSAYDNYSLILADREGQITTLAQGRLW